MVDVPLHVTNPPAIQRNVQVSGGTNWDLSRSAVQTPIRQLPDPVPVRVEQDGNWAKLADALPNYSGTDSIPPGIPSISTFGAKQAAVSKVATKALQSLSKKKAYVVVGHADAGEASPSKLSWARAKNVAAVLKRAGHTVTVVKAFGADRPASQGESAANRRVEVYSVAQ
jgi:outer membrane protein OmpA-like peptidoglycan-associated protein